MDRKNELIQIIGGLILKSDDLKENSEWQSLSLVLTFSDGYFADSGFLYQQEIIQPFSAYADDEDPFILRDKAQELKKELEKSADDELKQMLVQIDRDGRMKMQFEFDDPERWRITPSNINNIKEFLRPDFS